MGSIDTLLTTILEGRLEEKTDEEVARAAGVGTDALQAIEAMIVPSLARLSFVKYRQSRLGTFAREHGLAKDTVMLATEVYSPEIMRRLTDVFAYRKIPKILQCGRIKREIRKGNILLAGIAGALGLSTSHVIQIARQHNLYEIIDSRRRRGYMPKRRTRHGIQLNMLFSQGLNDTAVQETTGLAKGTIAGYREEYTANWGSHPPHNAYAAHREYYAKHYARAQSQQTPLTPARASITALADSGLTLEEIGARVGRTRERVRQIVNTTPGLQSRFKHARTLARQRTALFERIADALVSHHNTRAYDYWEGQPDGWAHQQAIAYVLRRKHKSDSYTPYEKLFGFFREYQRARENGETPSVEELGKRTGFGTLAICHIIRNAGLRTLAKPNKKVRVKTPAPLQEAILRAQAATPLSSSTIAHFAYIETSVPQQLARARDIILSTKKRFIAHIQVGQKQAEHRHLTYQLASKIYECIDAKFAPEETLEFTGEHPKVIDYAIAHRETIEPVIIGSLRIMYNTTAIIHPYLSRQERDVYLGIGKKQAKAPRKYGRRGHWLRLPGKA